MRVPVMMEDSQPTSPNPTAVLSPPATTPAVHRPKSSSPAAPPSPTDDKQASSSSSHKFDLPKLRLEIRDLTHPGANLFLTSVDTTTVLQTAIRNVLHLLYSSSPPPSKSPSGPDSITQATPTSDKLTSSSSHHTKPPPTRSVTLILRPMSGVAYTTGTDLDPDHKEIHLSLSYITSISPATRLPSELTGVLTHELVHCYQFNAHGTCPGGLIEGIADWVRLNCELAPPHWKKGDVKKGGRKWDAGYQHTGYFLEYLEGRFGMGSVRRVNERLRVGKYYEKDFWTGLFGRPVEQLWEDFVQSLNDDDEEKKKRDEDEPSK